MNKILTIFFICNLAYQNSFSQIKDLEFIKSELYKITQIFDSAKFLAFDVDIDFTSDTLFGKTESDHATANYILNGTNIFYRVANNEFMQNDSFSITANSDEQLLVVSKKMLRSNNDQFPLKEFTDSILNTYSKHYEFEISTNDTLSVIHFRSTSEDLPFSDLKIHFYSGTHLLKSYEVIYVQEKGNGEMITDLPAEEKKYNKKLSMQFYNYRYLNEEMLFKSSTYLFYDHVRNEFMGAGKYKDYKLITSNLSSSVAPDSDIETSATIND